VVTEAQLRRGRVRGALVLALLLTGLVALPAAAFGEALRATAAERVVAQGSDAATVGYTEVTGVITPITADHLAESVDRAAADGHRALVVQLDTPGGLVDATRRIVQTFLDAPLPVIVHVAPAGADAGSAGTFITYAAHVAAMSPATTIGAATPVGGQGEDLDDKIVENTAAFAEAIAGERDRDVDFAVEAVRQGRSVTADTALEEGAIDLIATDTPDLLTQSDGREVPVQGDDVTLDVADAVVVDMPVGTAKRILGFLADPNLAFIFLSIGTLAIVYEIANPGVGLGGVIGGVCIILAMVALAVLPVNVAGIALLLLAAGLFISELFAPGIGAGAGGGSIALLLAGLFLFPADTGLGVDLQVILPTVVVVGLLTVLAGRIVARTLHVPPRNYDDDLAGRRVVVSLAADGRPRALLDGTWWRLRANEGAGPLRDGDEVEIVGRENLDLLVGPLGAAADVDPERPATVPESDSGDPTP
jgi:membrane-bound serine protease (ClpP class)